MLCDAHACLVVATDMAPQISGFFIMRPASMYIWNVIRKWFQERIEDMGVEETSFPMFLSSKSLEKEKGETHSPVRFKATARQNCILIHV